MKILLDIDDTLINHRDVLHPRYREVLDNHDVILYSQSKDIKRWAKKLNLPYIHKDDEGVPEADVLIDDIGAFKKCVKVKYYFSSIDSFLAFVNKY